MILITVEIQFAMLQSAIHEPSDDTIESKCSRTHQGTGQRVQHFCQTRGGGVELSPQPQGGGYHEKRGEECSGNICKLVPNLTTTI
jgi:hypothetical protein